MERKLKELKMHKGQKNIDAFNAEPITGDSGDIEPTKDYYQKIQTMMNKYGIMFGADEMITSFGRTGSDFGCNSMGIEAPDMMTFAKQLSSAYMPISASAIRRDVYDAMIDQTANAGAFGHGYTYSGHPVACAAALKNIEIMEREQLLPHVQDIGPYFQTQLKTLADLHIVGDVRGIGLMACVEFVKDKTSKAPFSEELDIGKWISNQADSRGLIVRPIVNLNVMSPPLIINREQVDFIITTLRGSILACMDDLKQHGHL